MRHTLVKNLASTSQGPTISIAETPMLSFAVSAAQGSIVTGGTTGTNKLDNTATGYETFGKAESIAEIVVTTAFTTGIGFTALTVAAYTHSTTTITSGTKLAEITVPLANISTIGDRIQLRIPAGARQRYTGLVYTAVTQNPGAGAVTADITPSEIPEVPMLLQFSSTGTGTQTGYIETSFSGTGSWYRDVRLSGSSFVSRCAVSLTDVQNKTVQYNARAPYIRFNGTVSGGVVNATGIMG